MIAGLYPATRQIKEVDMGKIMEVINEYEKGVHGEARYESEYDTDDLVDEEGGE